MKKALPLLLLLLAACATPQQLAEQKRLRDEEDRQICLGYGFDARSDAYRQCLLQLAIARQQRYDTRTDSRFFYGYGHGSRYHGSSAGYFLGY